MNLIVGNRIITSNIIANRIVGNGGRFDKKQKIDENWFTLDVSALDGGDILQ